MNKLEFPQGFDIISELNTLYESNPSALDDYTTSIRFYDQHRVSESVGYYNISIELNKNRLYKSYIPVGERPESLVDVNRNDEQKEDFSDPNDVAIEYTGVKQWNEVNNISLSISPLGGYHDGFHIYLLDLDGNILTAISAYNKDTSLDNNTANIITVDGFTISKNVGYYDYNDYDSGNISFKYTGNPNINSIFYGYIAIVRKTLTTDLSTYYVFKIKLENSIRIYQYNNIELYFKYSTDTPVIDYTNNMTWDQRIDKDTSYKNKPTVNIEFDYNGNLKSNFNTISICKFSAYLNLNYEYLDETSINSNPNYRDNSSWVTVNTSTILNLSTFTFQVGTNSRGERTNDIIIYDDTGLISTGSEESDGYLRKILAIHIIQDGNPSVQEEEYDFYTIQYDNGGESTLDVNANLNLIISSNGDHIGTYQSLNLGSDYRVLLTKKRHISSGDVTQQFVDNDITIDASNTSSWVTAKKSITSNGKLQILIESKLELCPQGESRSNTFYIKDNGNVILIINVSLNGASGLPSLYYLFSKEYDEKEENYKWCYLASDNANISHVRSIVKFDYSGIPIPRYEGDTNPNVREYVLICRTSSLQLSIDDINISIDNGIIPRVTAEKIQIEAGEISGNNIADVVDYVTEGKFLKFTVTYNIVNELRTHEDLGKYINLSYIINNYILTNVYIMQIGVPYPINEISSTQDDSVIWDTFKTSSNYVNCIDTGKGINVDPESLLYKGSTANIYKTLEAKDSRLFLGNYKTPKLNSQIEEAGLTIFNSLREKELLNESTLVKESLYYKEVNIDDDTVHNIDYSKLETILDLSSHDERMFKYGESYLLGIVFVYKTGLKSNVYIINNDNSEDGTFTLLKQYEDNAYDDRYTKEYFFINVDTDTLSALNEAGIAAIIPVRAVNTNFRTIALGIGIPTFLFNNRKQDNRPLLSYLYRLDINLDDFQNNYIVDSEGIHYTANTEYNKVHRIITVNTPEMDCTEDLTLQLFNCAMNLYVMSPRSMTMPSLLNVHLLVDSKYVNSHQVDDFTNLISLSQLKSWWYGFLDLLDGSIEALTDNNNYRYFNIYIWNREIVGGEWPAAKIRKKVFVYKGGYSNIKWQTIENGSFTLYDNVKCYNYRNYDYPELINISNLNLDYLYFYLGNIDYTASSSNYYNIIGVTRELSDPKAVKATGSSEFKYTIESGIDNEGKCYAPLWIRYKSSPHLVVDLNTSNDNLTFDYSMVELYHVDPIIKDESTRIYSQWIKCGPIVSTGIPITRPLRFAAGDWFYGNYECLRTYPYSNDDPNLLVEVFKVPLMSKVNLALRADTNKGSATSYLSPVNFNLFNPVYNQEDNFFTYSYLPNNISYGRNFLNTVLWSLNKLYGAETDEWCHILDINSLDLDGDKGEITSLEKYNGMLIAFLTTGISLILFNDNVQISANDGTPIEIANSGIVNGKRYLQDRIGCLNRESIVNSPKALYFVDSINKSIYSIGGEGAVTDICYTAGMKSWALNNLNKDWWSYYDVYSQEVLFANGESCIAYNDMLLYFPCFLSYEKVKNILSLNGRTYLFNYNSNTLWKKNSINENKIFNTKVPIEVEIIANPEPTEDKTFETIEYRADGFTEYNELDLFSKDTIYNPTVSFDDIRVTNEYQDTDTVSLYKSADKNTYQPNSNLQKKFRIWRILIPRVAKSLLTSTTVYKEGLDRIRNPWCKIKLTTNMDNFKKLLVHDFAIKYTK